MYVPVVVIVIAHDAAAETGWLNVLSSAMGKKTIKNAIMYR